MSKSEKTVKFRLTYGELLQQSSEKAIFLRRDESILVSRGITSERLDLYELKIVDFRHTKDDITFLGLISDASMARDGKRGEVEIAGRDLLGMAETAFENNPGTYKSLGFVNLSKLNDWDFILVADNFHAKLSAHLAELTPHGISLTMLNDFRTSIDEFEPLVKNLAVAKINRDINTRSRKAIANDLYDEMVRLSIIAGNYFKNRDAGRCSDYFIYSRNSGLQKRKGSLKPNTKASRSFNGLNADKVLKFKNDGTGPLDFYFCPTEGGDPMTVFVTVEAYQEHSYPCSELGYDKETGALVFNIRNSSEADTSSYLVKIE